jgi:hypothetical protein
LLVSWAPLALEKAEVSAYVKEQLAKDRKLFGFVSKEGRATELARGGNVIDVEASKRIASTAAQAAEVYDRLSERAGTVAQVLDEASRQLAQGAEASHVKQQAYERIRSAVSQTLAGRQAEGVERGEAYPGPGARPQAEALPGIEPSAVPQFLRKLQPKPAPAAGAEAPLPGMQQAIAEQRTAAAEEQGRQLTQEIAAPAESVSRAAGEMERASPLFRESEAGGQKNLFGRAKPAEVAEAAPQPAPARPAPVLRAGKRAKAAESARLLREVYTPGNVVHSYLGYDKVLEFKEQGRLGSWEVKVIGSDKQGNPLPGEQPRWHATPPEKADVIAARQRLEKTRSAEAGFATPSMLTGGLLDKANIPDVLERFAGISQGQRLTSESRGIVRQNLAELARKQVVAEKAMEGEARRMDKLPLEAKYDFINRMERGQKQASPANQTLADTLRRMLDTKRTEVQELGTGALQNFIENYFPHIWERPDAAAQVLARIYSRRPLAGPKGFLKQRSIPTFEEGIAEGLKPVSDNPVTLTLLKLHEMDRYVFGQKILAEYKASGLAHFVPFGERPPDGYAKINDSIARALQYSESEHGYIVRGEYYAPEPAARTINRYLSPGLAEGLRRVGYNRAALAYEVARGFGNTLNQAQLGLSAFHGVFTSVDSMISDTALGLERITRGEPRKAVLPLLRVASFMSPIETYLTGSKVLKEYERPGTQGAHIAAIVDALEKGGGRARMDSFYKSDAVNSFWKAFERRSPSVAWRWLPAFFEYAARPLMEHTVPRMKLGVFHNLAQMELERHEVPSEGKLFSTSEAQVREAMGKAWDSVDNRMGQLVYDNLFWNRAAKDLGMVAIRSLGWNIGTVREIGGGLLDVARQPVRAALGEKMEVTHRMAYSVALPITVGWIGAVIGYLATGQRPQELKDYFFPRTGRMLPNGEPERFNIPSYIKDVLEVAKQPVRTVTGKLHPLVHATVDFLENKDFEGREIRHPDDPLVKQLADSLGFAASQLLPISARTALRQRESGASLRRQGLSFFGFNPAPRNITRTRAETLALELGQRYAPQGPLTAEQYDRREMSHQLLEKLRNKDITGSQVVQAVRDGKITERDARRIIQNSHRPPIVSTFHRLPLEDALKVWDVATPEERKQLRPALVRKTDSLENQPPAKRRELVVKLRAALRSMRTAQASRP